MTECLYIHIPFCIRKCIYCDFFSEPYDESLSRSYIDALCKELLQKKALVKTLKTVYIGGGTPSLLPDDCFRQLFKCLKDNYTFSADIEITVEANPGTIHESKIYTMISLGVNRLSIGVQSFNDNELKTLGRIHNAEDAFRSIETIKNTGLNNFSIDLMYGIPGQSIKSWHDSISKATEFLPSHISSYELTPEKNTLLFKLLGTHKISLPDEELILEMYNRAIDYFAMNGYEHYEISNFALPGFRCIHNLNYWDRGEYIAAGSGAHSFVNNVRSKNIKDIPGYIEYLNNGISTEIESTQTIPSEALKEFIFLGLRKTEGINIDALSSYIHPLIRGEKDAYNRLLHASKELIDAGYLSIDRDYIRLTRKGIVLSNTIIVRLFEILGL